MSSGASRRVRGARNLLIDRLGIGDALPLRDLPVTADPPVVPFGGTATIEIGDSEPGVAYAMVLQEGSALPGGVVITATGDGGTIALTTPAIEDNITYAIQATRPSGRHALLLATAPVKVGLDSTIPASVDGFARMAAVVDYGASVSVTLARTQVGVTYRLIARPAKDGATQTVAKAIASDIAIGVADVEGSGGAQTLTSIPLTDDVVLRVRVIKTFGGTRKTETVLLTQPLPIAVRANRARPIAVNPSIVEDRGIATLVVTAAQRGVTYRPFGVPVADVRFDRAIPSAPTSIEIATGDGPVRVRPLPLDTQWQPIAGGVPLGDGGIGDGSDLTLTLPPLDHDTMVVVQATKHHDGGAADSSVPLAASAVVLVRPSPTPGLRLEATITGDALVRLRALAGQAGVFYGLSANKASLGELYLHQVDADAATRTKGIGALAVEVDLVSATVATTGMAPPPVPVLDVDKASLPAEITIFARRAMTRLLAPLAATAVIAAPPATTIKATDTDPGKGATVSIAKTVAGSTYRLLIDGHAIGDPITGTGDPIDLPSGPLLPGASVELAIADPPAEGVEVERRIGLAVGSS